jgi:hypothetical protein
MPQQFLFSADVKFPILLSVLAGLASAGVDVFGILQMVPSLPGAREWNSAHWSNGVARRIQYSGDAFDPTGWTDNHSTGGNDSLFVDGKGHLLLSGNGPRFHINSTGLYAGVPPTPKVPVQSFLNLEATGYFRRLTTGGPAYAGMEIQARTGPLGHGSPGGDDCDATGLASRFRVDGKWDWEKELKHPDSKVYSTKAGSSAPLFASGAFPLNRWIGMKFIVVNMPNGRDVKLETYIDSTSDVSETGPMNGGNWERVGSVIDDGTNFPGGDISGCPDLVSDMAISQGNGTLLFRTDKESGQWKMVSVREIEPSAVSATLTDRRVKAHVHLSFPGRHWIPSQSHIDSKGRVQTGISSKGISFRSPTER